MHGEQKQLTRTDLYDRTSGVCGSTRTAIEHGRRPLGAHRGADLSLLRGTRRGQSRRRRRRRSSRILPPSQRTFPAGRASRIRHILLVCPVALSDTTNGGFRLLFRFLAGTLHACGRRDWGKEGGEGGSGGGGEAWWVKSLPLVTLDDDCFSRLVSGSPVSLFWHPALCACCVGGENAKKPILLAGGKRSCDTAETGTYLDQ